MVFSMHARPTALVLHSLLHGGDCNRGNGLGRIYETEEVLLNTGSMTVRMTKIKDLDAMLDDIDPITFADDERLPYWAELWPSAIGLARYLDRDVSLRGQHVLELGCGLGLLGVVAARDGGSRAVHRLRGRGARLCKAQRPAKRLPPRALSARGLAPPGAEAALRCDPGVRRYL